MLLPHKVAHYNLNFGMEIELTELSASTLQNTAYSITGRHWNIHYDGSIRGVSPNELVSPILQLSELDRVAELVDTVSRRGGRTNGSCGFHIHVGTDGMQAKHLVNLVKTVYKYEDGIYKVLGVSERRADPFNGFARRLNPQTISAINEVKPDAMDMDTFNRCWYGRRLRNPGKYNPTRYQGLNLNSHFYRGTAEFRWFNGTLSPVEIKSYTLFCLALMVRAREASHASSKRKELRHDHRDLRDWRVFLNQLGLSGREYKDVREVLSRNL